MRVGIIQSNYLPWRGYFDFIDEVDLFIVYDDVQYTVRDWRNRNRIKTADGTRWITVPIQHGPRAQLICETRIDYSRDWREEHRRVIATSLANAPYVDEALGLIQPAWDVRHETISELNIALLTAICDYLAIRTPLRMSSEFDVPGARTERLIELLAAVGATTYLSGPSARAYLDEHLFEDAGIALEYKNYSYPPYPQCWGAFEAAVSIVDTIANCGPEARRVLKSQRTTSEVGA